MAVLSGFPILATSDFERLVDFYCSAFDAEQTYADGLVINLVAEA